MNFDVWLKIAYIIQYIPACLIFIYPAREKRFFKLKMGICSLGLVFISYLISGWSIGLPNTVLWWLYWSFFIGAGIFISWVGLEGNNFLGAIYCAMCACATQHVAYNIYLVISFFGKNNVYMLYVYFLVYVVIYFIAYVLLSKKIVSRGYYRIEKSSLFPMVTIIVVAWAMSIIEETGLVIFEASTGHRIFYRILDVLCCVYVLWGQLIKIEAENLQKEITVINEAWRQQAKQYQFTKDTIENINQKCHDMKHQVRTIRQMGDGIEREAYLNELVEAISIYDTSLKTGNQALDTVLMEKGLYCKNHGIQWSCMVDASKLNFMKLEDIYSLFGNALDNAIFAVMELEDKEKKIINLKIANQKDFYVIQVQNYYDGTLKFENGLPITTKNNKVDHGYGMKSIKYIADKYNGTLTVSASNNIFTMQILLLSR